MCILFDLTYFREIGQKYRIIFARFLVQMKISKSRRRFFKKNVVKSHYTNFKLVKSQKEYKLLYYIVDDK